MDLGLDGRVALIGGGSEGIGYGVAEVLAAEGVKLAIYGLGDDRLQEARSQLSAIAAQEVLAIACDVRVAADCDRAVRETVARFGRLDFMLTNMKGSYGTPFPDDDARWADAWELWTMGPVRLMRSAVPEMRRSGGGSIVNLTSCGVHQMVHETRFSEVPRLALTGYAKYQATELAPENIRVNNILPGWVMTPRAEERFRAVAQQRGVSPSEIEREEAAAVPMGRFASPAEIGRAVAFLFSDAASYITGTNLRVDGGWCENPVA
ncbi:SDR family oxidoreductase [Conexibacter sp. CPCC 206217]|uniref:SDR family oxidoreductase n=1 Tax=Conexibacter sp. CPCC 206217 TaxID=3064574 RepID=UPI00271E4DFA|nr:SDR family oxidoreductase [Conexibacter sp. CPCC 206217]MDO8211985.1 SDR family oxidoreductase [Conexibacter sp. CPCC 206217]